MNAAIIAGAAVALILLLRRKKALEVVQEKVNFEVDRLRSKFSVNQNLAMAVEFASFGGGAGFALGGPIGFVVGTGVGWVAGLIALAIRGGVRMGLEVRNAIAAQFRELGFPNEAAAMDFLIFAVYLVSTNRCLTVCENGQIQVPFLPDRAHWGGESQAGTIEGYVDTFWSMLFPSTVQPDKCTTALRELISRNGHGSREYIDGYQVGTPDRPVHFDLALPPGRWGGTKKGGSLEDVPFLATLAPALDVPHMRRRIYTGLLRENPTALKLALRWSATKFGVQNASWLNEAIDTLGD